MPSTVNARAACVAHCSATASKMMLSFFILITDIVIILNLLRYIFPIFVHTTLLSAPYSQPGARSATHPPTNIFKPTPYLSLMPTPSHSTIIEPQKQYPRVGTGACSLFLNNSLSDCKGTQKPLLPPLSCVKLSKSTKSLHNNRPLPPKLSHSIAEPIGSCLCLPLRREQPTPPYLQIHN